MKNSMFKTGRFLLLMAGLLTVMSACKKENTTSELRAVMNDFANTNQKAYIDSKQYSCFIINEKVRVNSSTGTITALTRNDRQCTIDGVPEVSSYKAFYPYHLLVDSANVNLNDANGLENKAVYFPQVQQYKTDANGIQKIDNPMIAELSGFGSNNNTLHFRNLCALLKITVRTLDAFDAIHVTMSGQKLWGFGKISGSKVVMNINAANDSETVILSLPTGHSAGEAFYIMIPEVSLSNSSVTVSIMNGSTPVKTFSRTGVTGTLAYNRIHTLGNFTFNAPVFSVAPDKTVVFAPGNLQWSYRAMATSHSVASHNSNDYQGGTWRFAPNQYDVIGSGNDYPSFTSNSWYDLFAWGGSGKGSSLLFPDGTNYYSNAVLGDNDWGSFNTIYNPQTKVNDPHGTWFTLNESEWIYVLNGRREEPAQTGWWCFSTVNVDFGSGNILHGLIIYPDGITGTPLYHNINHDNTSPADITKSQYDTLESIGCAFLPNAGRLRYSSGAHSCTAYEVNNRGFYWISSMLDNTKVSRLIINNNGGYVIDEANTPEGWMYDAVSVRLAFEVQ